MTWFAPRRLDHVLMMSFLGQLPTFAEEFQGYLDDQGMAQARLAVSGLSVNLIGMTVRFAGIAG